MTTVGSIKVPGISTKLPAAARGLVAHRSEHGRHGKRLGSVRRGLALGGHRLGVRMAPELTVAAHGMFLHLGQSVSSQHMRTLVPLTHLDDPPTLSCLRNYYTRHTTRLHPHCPGTCRRRHNSEKTPCKHGGMLLRTPSYSQAQLCADPGGWAPFVPGPCSISSTSTLRSSCMRGWAHATKSLQPHVSIQARLGAWPDARAMGWASCSAAAQALRTNRLKRAHLSSSACSSK